MNGNFEGIRKELDELGVTLVAVSKTKPVADILELYQKGQRDFGENKVQEMVEKSSQLPADIRWHLIGHLQKNKVKYIAPFVHLIHSVDGEDLLAEIEKQAARHQRTIPCLLQVYIASEETKFGMDSEEVIQLLPQVSNRFPHIQIAGLMGMATFTDQYPVIRAEFRQLKALYDRLKNDFPATTQSFSYLSMGMSSDYHIAIEEGSNMVRIGTLLFGARN